MDLKAESLRTLSPFTVGRPPTRFYHWHRALGLSLALPALVLVFAGIVRAFDDPLAAHFEAARPPPTASRRRPNRGSNRPLSRM
jgi:hypothetical protein